MSDRLPVTHTTVSNYYKAQNPLASTLLHLPPDWQIAHHNSTYLTHTSKQQLIFKTNSLSPLCNTMTNMTAGENLSG